jgi:hypothetical protein
MNVISRYTTYLFYELGNIFGIPIYIACKVEIILNIYKLMLNSAHNFAYNPVMKFTWGYIYKMQT